MNDFNIHLINAVIDSKDGKVDLFYEPGNLSISYLKRDKQPSKKEVRITKLSTFMKENNIRTIDTTKIDVEGFESNVLKGLEGKLEEKFSLMLLEVLNDETGKKIEELINRHYLIFHIDESGKIVRKNTIRRVSGISRNYLLCKPSIAKKLGLGEIQ